MANSLALIIASKNTANAPRVTARIDATGAGPCRCNEATPSVSTPVDFEKKNSRATPMQIKKAKPAVCKTARWSRVVRLRRTQVSEPRSAAAHAASRLFLDSLVKVACQTHYTLS